MVWYPKMDQKLNLFNLNMVKKDQLCAVALNKKKINFEGATQNGCYDN